MDEWQRELNRSSGQRGNTDPRLILWLAIPWSRGVVCADKRQFAIGSHSEYGEIRFNEALVASFSHNQLNDIGHNKNLAARIHCERARPNAVCVDALDERRLARRLVDGEDRDGVLSPRIDALFTLPFLSSA